MTTENVTIDGCDYAVTWLPKTSEPPRELTVQAGGLCFADDGRIVLVTSDDVTWTLPAGHVEPGESLARAFVREVREEACAQVGECSYIGCQKIVGPALDPDWKEPLHYSARFWARVELLPFAPAAETTGRRLVLPSELIPSLRWKTVRCAEAMLRAAEEEEQKRTGRST